LLRPGYWQDKNDPVTKKKLVHFKENLTFPHLFQPHYHEIQSGFFLQSNWGNNFFHNRYPIVVELGCGKGEYTVGLAQKFPDQNFIGIDVKGARLWRGAKTAQENEMKNVAFIRQRVDFIDKLIGQGEISEIWITFPDPQVAKEHKRLTSPRFLEKYKKILGPGGMIHLKTDDLGFFNYTKEIIQVYNHIVFIETEDFYNSEFIDDNISIQTYYEKMWLEQDKKICYLKFMLS
jgi:tRNA (guanine-N7-)-methyltransferase